MDVDEPQTLPVASTSTNTSPSSLEPHSLKQIQDEILSEHFYFHPVQFTSEVFNFGNDAIYDTMPKIEEVLEKEKVGSKDEIDHGLHKLETLCEHAVDKHFDLCEAYLLRNTFNIDPELLPYIQLDTWKPNPIKGKGKLARDASGEEGSLEGLFAELQVARTEYVNSLDNKLALDAVDAAMNERDAALQSLRSELDFLSDANSGSTLLQKIRQITQQLPILQSQTSSLLSHKPGAPMPQATSEEDEQWKSLKREEYVNWAAEKKVPAVGAGGLGGVAGGDTDMTVVRDQLVGGGDENAAKDVLSFLGPSLPS